MICENEICIFNKEGKCTLDTISLDAIGLCEDCVIVELDEALIEKEKERQLLERIS